MRWSAEELADLLDHVPASITLWDSSLRNEFLNASSFELLGLPPQDTYGWHVSDVLGTSVYKPWMGKLLDRAMRGGPMQYVHKIIREDGGEESFDTSWIALPSEDGSASSLVGMTLDVSGEVTADALRRDVAPFIATVRARDRLARELESSLTGQLTELVVDLRERAERVPVLAQSLREAAQLTETAVDQLRASLHYRVQAGIATQFQITAQRLVRESADALGFVPTLVVDGPCEQIGSGLARDLLAVLTEGLSNVARHAQASEAAVEVSVIAGGVTVTVADNGRGLGAGGAGSGTRNLCSRARRRGGTCSWRRTEARRTVLEWRVPLSSAEADVADPADDGREPLELPARQYYPPGIWNSPIRVSARRLLQVLDALPSAVAAWDGDERLVFANEACMRWFGGPTRDDVLGRAIDELIPAEEHRANVPFIRSALAGESTHFERAITDGYGVARAARVLYTPRWRGGAVVGWVVQAFDVSDRTAAQAELQRNLQQMTALEERRRFAEDLHDIVIQHLFAAGLRLDSVLPPAEPVEAAELVQEAIARVDEAIARLRESITTLRTAPSVPDQPVRAG